ncbi:hypothetical protein [Actinomadura rifamycini]|uniref:hypothetical protein n=1 Tax=Actinomadura rifamycini TaxID=31962 RepID=UPI000425C0A0|nr:hypothetical protein [Actinomadura rifamycini]
MPRTTARTTARPTARPAARVAAGLAAGALVAGAVTAGALAADTPPRADAAAAAAAAPGHTDARRGSPVSARHLGGMTAAEIRPWLAGAGFDTASVRYGTDAYRLVYRTIDAHGRPTVASGLLVLPRSAERRLRTVSYTHGTTSYKPDAPSVADDAWARGPAVAFGAAGFAAVAPDYLGLGEGPGVHPWKHVPSETSAALDMLRAARAFAPRRGRALERDVLVTGFSQGASSALGLARALQEGADRRFRVRAVAPVSGAYDFRGAELPALLNGEIDPRMGVAYAAYLLTSWNRVYGGVYREPSELFRTPYAARVEKYFDGTTPGPVMLRGLPGTLEELLTPRGMDLLRHPSGTFAEGLRVDAEVCTAWTPRAPVRLYRMDGDEQAVTANTAACAASLRERGAPVSVVDLDDRLHEGSRHLGSNVAATGRTVRWFAGLR